jgi:uncharacterized protein (DUF58 family)
MREQLRRRFVRENRIYIMPSASGVLFLVMVLVFVLTAATYNNNLIFLLAFFQFSFFVVSMLQTHYNMKDVRLIFISAEETFADQPMALLFHIEKTRARSKHSLVIRSQVKNWPTLQPGRADMRPEDKIVTAKVEVKAWTRGQHQIPRVILETQYPLGLFRAWKEFWPQGQVIVYPKSEGSLPLAMEADMHGEEELGLRNSPEGDFGELKNYAAGESYHQIAWKAYARTGQLYTKVLWGSEHKHFRIPWQQKFGSAQEQYLAQMSRWIQEAVEQGASFEMQLPDEEMPPGQGESHARLCWRALAKVKVA